MIASGRTAAAWRRASGLLLAAVWGVELLNLAWPALALTTLASGLLALYVAFAFARARWPVQMICATLAGLTAAIVWHWGRTDALFAAVEIALTFAAFFASLQLLRAIAERDPRVAYVRRRSRTMPPGARRASMLLVSHFLGAVLATGVLAVMAPTVPRDAAASERMNAAESALLGLGLAIVWSPFFVAMGIVTSLSPGVREWQLIACGVLVGVLGLTLAYRQIDGHGLGGLWVASRAILPILGISIALAVVIVAVTFVTGWSNLKAVVLSVPLLTALALWRRPAAAWVLVGTRTLAGLSAVGEEIVLVVSAMFFGQAVLATPEITATLAGAWLVGYPSGLYLAGAGAAMVCGALVGVHPLVTASVLLPLLHTLPTGASDLAIALAVLAGWGSAVIVSMWVVPVIVGSSMFQVSPNRLAFGANFRVAIEFLVLAVGAIALAEYLVGLRTLL